MGTKVGTRIRGYAGMALLFSACDNPAEPVPVPADVRITTAVAQSTQQAERLTLGLENRGGGGGFKLRVTTLSNVPNGPRPTTESEDMPIVAGWRETLVFDLTGACCSIARVEVWTRNEGGLQYRHTSSHDFF